MKRVLLSVAAFVVAFGVAASPVEAQPIHHHYHHHHVIHHHHHVIHHR